MKFLYCLLCFCCFSFLPGVRTGDVFAADKKNPDLLSDDFYDDMDDADDADDKPSAQPPRVVIHDPWENMNRRFFAFNDKMYDYVLKPATDVYIWLLPEDLRGCFGNFFANIAMPVRLVNSVLQLDFETSGVVLGSFLINSTVGIYGMVDVAKEHFHLTPRRADFGQTLGRWGVGEGIYIYWPVIGPSTVRDSVGFVVDNYTHPVPYLYPDNYYVSSGYYATTRINSLSMNPNMYDDVRKYSLDPYVAIRQAYYDYRRALVGRKWKAIPKF